MIPINIFAIARLRFAYLSILLFSFYSNIARAQDCQTTLFQVRQQLVMLRELSELQEQDLTSSQKQLEKLKTDNAELQTKLMTLSSSLTAAQIELSKTKQQKRTAVILGISIGASVMIASSVGLGVLLLRSQ